MGALAELQRNVGNRAVTALVQRQNDETVGDQVRSALRAGGAPLDSAFRARAEQFFGADLSQVRVHVNSAAAESAEAVSARAYTSGSDVVFARGMYDTSSAVGQQRLAHELTHVVQQQRGPVAGTPTAGGLKISDPSDRFEREADQLSNAFVAGRPAQAAAPTVAASEPVQRVTQEKLQTQSLQRLFKKKTTIGAGTDKVSYRNKREKKEAEDIAKKIKDNYGIDINSDTTVEAIKQQYTNVPGSVTKQLKQRTWRVKELRALETALDYYAPILGAKRAGSQRSGDSQEVTSVGKVERAVDENTSAGKLDKTTLGEYFRAKKNMGLFRQSEGYKSDFKKEADQLVGTFVHETAHGLLKYALPDFISASAYWSEKTQELPSSQREEEPPTKYGRTNAEEDLCETAMLYFVDPDRLRRDCSKRFEFMKQLKNDWLPAPAASPMVVQTS